MIDIMFFVLHVLFRGKEFSSGCLRIQKSEDSSQNNTKTKENITEKCLNYFHSDFPGRFRDGTARTG